jgi:hypothetical protein
MRPARLPLLVVVALSLPWGAAAQVPKSLPAPGAVAGQTLVANGLSQMVDFDDEYGLGRRADAGFVIAARKGLARWMWYNGFVPAAVRIEVSVTLVSGPTNVGYGIAFGRATREPSPWMSFQVAGDGHYRLVGFGGAAAVPWRLKPAVPRGLGARNRLAVEVRGHNVTLYVNGVAVDGYYADRDVAGALAAELSTGVEARFEDLRVTALDAGSVPPAVPAAPVVVTPIPPPVAVTQVPAAPVVPQAQGPLTPPAAAPAAGDVLLAEDFAGAQVVDDEYGRTEYALDGLLATARQPMLNWMTERAFPSRARITLTVQQRAGSVSGQYGLAFGRPGLDVNQAMELLVAADGSWQLDNYGGTPLQPRTFTPAVRPGTGVPNVIRVDVRGTQVTAYVNGALLGTFTASREVAGYVGIHASAGLQVLFQHLRVERLP